MSKAVKGTVYTLGHPEPVTLCRFRPEIQDCYNVMDFPLYLISILKNLAQRVDAGKISVKEAADIIESLEGKGFTGILFSSFGLGFLTAVVRQIVRPQRSFPGDFALAVGRKGDRETTVAAHLKSLPRGGLENITMGSITGIPMAIGLKMLADGHISRKGVFAPEVGIIKNVVCETCNVKEKDLRQSKRGTYNEPRNVAMYLVSRMRGDSRKDIGAECGMKKYSPVSSVIERMKGELSKNSNMRKRVENYETSIRKSQEQT